MRLRADGFFEAGIYYDTRFMVLNFGVMECHKSGQDRNGIRVTRDRHQGMTVRNNSVVYMDGTRWVS